MDISKLKNQPLPPFLYPTSAPTRWAISGEDKSVKQDAWFESFSLEKETYQKGSKSLTDERVEPPKVQIEAFEVNIENELIGQLPIQLYEIKKSIDEAFYMLHLKEDWDDEGGMPVDKNTFIRAIRFLINYSVWLLKNQKLFLAPPQIHPGPDGSVDILWRTINFRLLINIPQDSGKQAGYYGDDKKDGNSIEGKIPTKGIKEFLGTWMKNLKS